MLNLDALPYNVVRDPDVWSIDVVPLYRRYTVQITDAWGKLWYIRTVGRNYYDWTRSRLYARTWTRQTAQKHMDRIITIFHENERKA